MFHAFFFVLDACTNPKVGPIATNVEVTRYALWSSDTVPRVRHPDETYQSCCVLMRIYIGQVRLL